MKSEAPPLFPLMRSSLQAKILSRTFLGGEEESVADLASAIDADPGNTAREVGKLERAEVLVSRRVGRTKLVRADRSAPHYKPLYELVEIVLGPPVVLAEHLADVSGIVSAEIFGSWAARASGEPGPAPNDIDLVVIGDPDRDDLHEATREAQSKLNRSVNPIVISEDRWNASTDGFVRELRSRPRVPIHIPIEQEGSP